MEEQLSTAPTYWKGGWLGCFFTSGTGQLEISPDGTNWFLAVDFQGDNPSLSTAVYSLFTPPDNVWLRLTAGTAIAKRGRAHVK